jgi:hypothetical protein
MRARQVDGKVKKKKIDLYALQTSVVHVFFFFILFESFLSELRFFLSFMKKIRKNELS